jgi:sarcosine oxidase subunit gamma
MLEALPLMLPATAAVALAPARHVFSVTAFAGAAPRLETALGIKLPAANHSLADGAITWFWSGPDSWLAMAAAAFDGRLAAAAPYAAITDQSDGRAIFLVSGPRSREILEKLVPIDLHEAEFSAGHTALTLAGHIPVQIWREGEAFALACFRSFANALHHALAQAETPGRG